jgi:hypothetical protein
MSKHDRQKQLSDLGHIPGIDAFFEAGGEVSQVPAEIANPKKFESIKVAKRKKLKGKIYGYEPEKVPRGEMLSSKLNLGSQDFSNIGRSSVKDRITPGQIHAALAQAGIREHEEKFMLYVWTEDKQYRSAAWAQLLSWLIDTAIEEDWDVRKNGVMDELAQVALDNFINPAAYHLRSARAWARDVGLACHKDWQSTWAERYKRLMSYGDNLIERGENILATGI